MNSALRNEEMKQQTQIFIVFFTLQSLILNADCIAKNEDGPRKDESCGDITRLSTYCYTDIKNDSLPDLQEEVILSHEDAIFFIDSKCKGGLTEREVCSVEAAAKLHPDVVIFVLFAGPVAPQCFDQLPMHVLDAYDNIQFYRINTMEYVKNTPLDSFPILQIVRSHANPAGFLSDILKLLTLYKYGGIQIDLDVLVVRPLLPLLKSKHWVGYTQARTLTIETAIMAASKTRNGEANKFINYVIKLFKKKYFQGPLNLRTITLSAVVSEAVQQLCKKTLQKMTQQDCQDLFALPKSVFYQPDIAIQRGLFQQNKNFVLTPEAIAIHTYSSLTQFVTIQENSVYGNAMEKVCPSLSVSIDIYQDMSKRAQKNTSYSDMKQVFYFKSNIVEKPVIEYYKTRQASENIDGKEKSTYEFDESEEQSIEKMSDDNEVGEIEEEEKPSKIHFLKNMANLHREEYESPKMTKKVKHFDKKVADLAMIF